jgi:hypothetical protein
VKRVVLDQHEIAELISAAIVERQLMVHLVTRRRLAGLHPEESLLTQAGLRQRRGVRRVASQALEEVRSMPASNSFRSAAAASEARFVY